MTLVDTNALLDLVTDDPVWADWSIVQFEAARGPIYIKADGRYSKAQGVFSDVSGDFVASRASPVP